jgi:hypothetical protein
MASRPFFVSRLLRLRLPTAILTLVAALFHCRQSGWQCLELTLAFDDDRCLLLDRQSDNHD